jgi:dolichol-phosphate mannosyltransferase
MAAILEEGRRAQLRIEVLVVDGWSTDGTRERVLRWTAEGHPVRLVAREGPRGLAGAVLAGAEAASAPVVVVLDADLGHPPDGIPKLAGPVLEGMYDFAIGSRYVPGGSTPGRPVSRRAASRMAGFTARLLVGARDPLSGFFATRREVLLEAGKRTKGLEIALQVLAGSLGPLRVLEVPIAIRDRTGDRSKMGIGIAIEHVRRLLELSGSCLASVGAS